MKTETLSDTVVAARLLSASILTAVGAVLTHHEARDAGIRWAAGSAVAVGILGLGLWLLVSAWTGRSVLERLRRLVVWQAGLGGGIPSVDDREGRPSGIGSGGETGVRVG